MNKAYVRLLLITVVEMKTTIFRDATLCGPVKIYKAFGEVYWFHVI